LILAIAHAGASIWAKPERSWILAGICSAPLHAHDRLAGAALAEAHGVDDAGPYLSRERESEEGIRATRLKS